ncbi:carboxypeptidase-like regulatory domain-containing protein [Flavobacterium sp. 3HN19-14]|uniref:carboxypeptidase-like regulatory domain-containing protein n=1 Tax=Flavobacterium sp. 3HN19-14 TaxID=3448133 RepID=UPI003EE206C3
MKKIFHFVLLLVIFSANAQNYPVAAGLKGKITGMVTDSITKAPVDYASVSLYKTDSTTPITGALTDETGSFKLNEVPAGTYTLAISFIGYNTRTITPITTTDAKLDASVGKIILSSETNTLKEVVVVGNTQLVSNKIDKIVYNVEKDVTAGGGNASDVLQKVPLVNVDMEGKSPSAATEMCAF